MIISGFFLFDFLWGSFFEEYLLVEVGDVFLFMSELFVEFDDYWLIFECENLDVKCWLEVNDDVLMVGVELIFID